MPMIVRSSSKQVSDFCKTEEETAFLAVNLSLSELTRGRCLAISCHGTLGCLPPRRFLAAGKRRLDGASIADEKRKPSARPCRPPARSARTVVIEAAPLGEPSRIRRGEKEPNGWNGEEDTGTTGSLRQPVEPVRDGDRAARSGIAGGQ